MRRAGQALSGIFTIITFLFLSVQSGQAADGWIPLFDGETLDGWTASENKNSVKVQDGMIYCDGPRSHLFYSGSVENANYKNFEFKADVMARHGANSGIYIHTEYQEEGWPEKGYEIQVNNTQEPAGNYYERKRPPVSTQCAMSISNWCRMTNGLRCTSP